LTDRELRQLKRAIDRERRKVRQANNVDRYGRMWTS
jgi:hypothetical protein